MIPFKFYLVAMVEYNQELEFIFLFVIIKQFDIGKIYHMDRLLPRRIKYIKFYNIMCMQTCSYCSTDLFLCHDPRPYYECSSCSLISIIGGEKKKQIPVEIEYLILGFHK